MSFGKKTATYAATAAAIAIAIIAIATFYAGPSALPSIGQNTSNPSTLGNPSQNQGQVITTQVISTSIGAQQTSNALLGASPALFLVQLTDPPVVPVGTTSLNLTYSAINLIVAEQGANNQVTTSDVGITPQGGSAKVDLLKLQNVSQTIASANLPSGSTIYSATFTVTGISIEINGTTSPVTLATGGKTFQVTFATPAVVNGTTAALLELNPIVVNTPTGYQMIPSAVGVTKPHAEITEADKVIGSHQNLTNEDKQGLGDAKGQVSARLVALSASGTTTTVTVQVNNTGSSAVQLVAIGLHGNFTRQGPACGGSSTASTTTSTTTSTSTSTSTSSTSTHGKGEGEGNNANKGNGNGGSGHEGGNNCKGGNEVVFVPVLPSTSSSTTSTSTSATSTTTTTIKSSSTSTAAQTCTTGQLATVNGDQTDDNEKGLTLNPGQCVTLTFTGVVTFGESSLTVVPSTASGQTYTLHVIASNNAETMLNCVLPLTKTSCTLTNQHND